MPTTTMDGVRNFFDLLLAIAWPLLVTCAYFAIAVSLRRIIMAWPTDDDTIMRQFAPRAVILVGILFFINTATMAFYTYGSIIAEIAGTSRFVASHQLGLSAMDTISQVGMQFTNFFSCAINAAISWLLIREGRAQLALDRAAPPEPTPAA